MEITLLHNTPLWVCATGIRTCWQSFGNSDTSIELICSNCQEKFVDNSLIDDECPECLHGTVQAKTITGSKDKELIDRIGNKFKHASTLEHLNYTFYIKGISRACLQELARHRHASLSVKSTRYTLKELKEEKEFTVYQSTDTQCGLDVTIKDVNRANKYIVLTKDHSIDMFAIQALENTRKTLKLGKANDIAKYCIPESYKTELTWTINARSLQNFLSLRSDKAALWEIRDLANAIFDKLPEEHKYLFEDFIKNKASE